MFEDQFLYFISYWDCYTQAVLKFTKLITETQQREAKPTAPTGYSILYLL
jgi:hypothetical protein